jgi:hypothetical protein
LRQDSRTPAGSPVCRKRVPWFGYKSRLIVPRCQKESGVRRTHGYCHLRLVGRPFIHSDIGNLSEKRGTSQERQQIEGMFHDSLLQQLTDGKGNCEQSDPGADISSRFASTNEQQLSDGGRSLGLQSVEVCCAGKPGKVRVDGVGPGPDHATGQGAKGSAEDVIQRQSELSTK